jgi:hypothetical protein
MAYSLHKVITLSPHRDFQPSVKEYEQLKPFIQDYEMVGFVTDTTGDIRSTNIFLIQYAIAPILLNRDADCCGVLVGYFINSAPPENYEIIETINSNLFLLKEKALSHETE